MRETSRLRSLDLIRGIAICGLVPINILDFASTKDWLLLPTVLPFQESLVAHFMAVFMNGKFISLFSMLFGVGMILQTEKYAAANLHVAKSYLPRLAWLGTFGLIHAYFIWNGDILVGYAITGLLIFLCRKWSAKTMAIVGWSVQLSIMLIITGLLLLACFLGAAEDIDLSNQPSVGTFFDKSRFAGSYFSEQLPLRAVMTLLTHIFFVPFYIIPSCGSLMLIGMSLYKSGFFNNEGPSRKQILVTMTLGIISIIVATVGATLILADGNNSDSYGKFTGLVLIPLPIIAVFYALLICLWSKSLAMHRLKQSFQAVGRMAFSNYLSQSIIFSLLFYGHGLALMDQLSYFQVLMITPAVWVVQLSVSTLWLGYFKQGPLEFVWRKLAKPK